jgi:hypothetical protein
MKTIGLLVAATLACACSAQNPNVLVKLDVRLSYHDSQDRSGKFHAYDPLGRQSTVTLQFSLEPGFDLVLSQRFEPIDEDSDLEDLDEYYLEDPGYWRLGKQYWVFGRGHLLRESTYAASVNTSIGAKAIPIVISGIQGRPGLPRGFAARLGSKIGLSYADGEHFGIGATSLTLIRRPEDSPGRERGYGKVYGADVALSKGPLSLIGEHANFEEPSRAGDEELAVTDLSLAYRFDDQQQILLGLTREWRNADQFVRIEARKRIHPSVYLEPIAIWKNGRIRDWGLTLRIKP